MTVHALRALVAQRVFGLALGYEDLNDHDALRGDPVLGVLLGKLERDGEAPELLAGKSTLNRLEHAPGAGTAPRYHKIGHDRAAIEKLFVELFLDAHQKAPRQIVLDLDATDDPLHGDQEGRFFHGYYDCYCYLPLYVFCGRHLLAAKLRRSDIDGSAGSVEEMERIVAQIRERWPKVKIVLRADSGFAREASTRSITCSAWRATRGWRGASPTRWTKRGSCRRAMDDSGRASSGSKIVFRGGLDGRGGPINRGTIFDQAQRVSGGRSPPIKDRALSSGAARSWSDGRNSYPARNRGRPKSFRPRVPGNFSIMDG